MKQIVLITTLLFAVANAYGQSFEEKAAKIACDCVQKIENPDESKYIECISNAMAQTLTSNPGLDEMQKISTVQGVQNTAQKIDSILFSSCKAAQELFKPKKEEKPIAYRKIE